VKLRLQKVLTLPGVHFLATRFGSDALRKQSFDEKYRDGTWNFAADRSSEMVALVEGYAQQGQILVLGCGTAAIASALDAGKFASLLGVDLSEEAIARARKQENEKIRFQVGDMLKHQCATSYDLILFPESIYYVSVFRRKRLLKRLAQCLTKGGRIMVTLAQPNRYAGTLRMIRRCFQVVEDRYFLESKRYLIVFH
jgi:trans-aconitate methyltransferase